MSTEITKDADALELPVEEIPAKQDPFVVVLPPFVGGMKIEIRNMSDRHVTIFPPRGEEFTLDQFDFADDQKRA